MTELHGLILQNKYLTMIVLLGVGFLVGFVTIIAVESSFAEEKQKNGQEFQFRVN